MKEVIIFSILEGFDQKIIFFMRGVGFALAIYSSVANGVHILTFG